MSELPRLCAEGNFTLWQSRMRGYFALKNIGEEAQKNLLPLCLSDDIALQVTGLSTAKSTLNTCFKEIEEIWLNISRPVNPQRCFSEVNFEHPRDVFDARLKLIKLANYIDANDKQVRQQLVIAAPSSLRAVVTSFVIGSPKLSSFELAQFIVQLPYEEISVSNAIMTKCQHCGKTGHLQERCWKLLKCRKCDVLGHIARFCKASKN
jgi:hypothetical protein